MVLFHLANYIISRCNFPESKLREVQSFPQGHRALKAAQASLQNFGSSNATHGLLHQLLISWIPSRQQEEISEERFERKRRKLCQLGSDVPTSGKGHP